MLAACGGSAQNQPSSAPDNAASAAAAAQSTRQQPPNPRVVQALEQIEARLADLEQGQQRLEAIAERLAALERRVEKGLARRPIRRPRFPRPDPASVYAVPIDGAPYKGPEHAKVTMVKAFEFACPYCRRVRSTIDELRKIYGRDLKVVYKHYIVHPQTATLPAQATCAANLQGQFAELEKRLWERIYDVDRNFGRRNLLRHARKVGVRMSKFKADMDGLCREIVRADQVELARVGARGTPAFFINGRFLSGARPIDHFKQLIDEELQKAEQRIAQGTPVRDYYRKWVLEYGQKTIESANQTP